MLIGVCRKCKTSFEIGTEKKSCTCGHFVAEKGSFRCKVWASHIEDVKIFKLHPNALFHEGDGTIRAYNVPLTEENIDRQDYRGPVPSCFIDFDFEMCPKEG